MSDTSLPEPTEQLPLEEALIKFNEFINSFPQRVLIAKMPHLM
jgi:hypothetical protein